MAAAPAAIVDAVQLPATLVRNARAQPLAPGMEVRHGDQISTGAGARVYLRLAEGSVVKMGESATFDFYATSTRPETFFRGALNVVKGAFRFTTGALAKLRGRDVGIRVGTATIGIRGTDVWGRSNAEKDLVCLIEGHVDVRHPAWRNRQTWQNPEFLRGAQGSGTASRGSCRSGPAGSVGTGNRDRGGWSGVACWR